MEAFPDFVSSWSMKNRSPSQTVDVHWPPPLTSRERPHSLNSLEREASKYLKNSRFSIGKEEEQTEATFSGLHAALDGSGLEWPDPLPEVFFGGPLDPESMSVEVGFFSSSIPGSEGLRLTTVYRLESFYVHQSPKSFRLNEWRVQQQRRTAKKCTVLQIKRRLGVKKNIAWWL